MLGVFVLFFVMFFVLIPWLGWRFGGDLRAGIETDEYQQRKSRAA